uniref:TxnU1 n=1 Tax=Streptomyces bottropensis TaxID=42235 RepID=A0A0K1H3E8_9ACTN|nr:TxnU1 [Streptomyces bottropensis]
MPPAAAKESPPRGLPSPVGTWTARVRRPGGDSAGSFCFTAYGHALLTVGGVGAGRWSSLGPGDFLFRITEPLLDDRGACVGWVDIEQLASQRGGSFTSRGTSRVYDADGRLTRAVPVEIHATRVGS